MSMYPGSSKYKKTRYDDVKKTLQTGDILLFSSGELTSWGIRIITNSPWSHVGMVIRSKELEGREKLYIWHSVQQNIDFTRDILTETNKQGPQLNNLRTMIKHSAGAVYVRRLHHVQPTFAIGDPIVNLRAYFEKTAKKDYEQNFFELARSQLDAPIIGKNEEDMSSVFCSELMASTYREFGYMANPGTNSNEFVPSDFSSGHTFHLFAFARSFFKLSHGMKWGVENELIL